MKYFSSAWLYLFSTIFFVLTVVIIQFLVSTMHSGGIYYGFFSSHNLDYFHYTTIIRNGLEEGGILFHNQYNDPWKPDVLFMPFYKVFGFVGNILRTNQFVTYFFVRNISSFIYVSTIVFFITNVYKRNIERISAVVLSLTVTAIWFFSQCGNIQCVQDPTTYMRPHFSSFYRLLVLAPHHYLGAVLLMLNMILVSRYSVRFRWLLLYALTSICMTLLHPYFGASWMVILCMFICISFLFERSSWKKYVPLFLLSCGLVFPLLYINFESYKLNGGPKVHLQITSFFLPLPILNYLKGTGFILFPFLCSFLFVNVWKKNKLLIFCLAWFLTPFVLYLTPVVNQLLSFYRPFQIIPQIPAAIFSVVMFMQIMKRYKRLGRVLTIVTILSSLAYHGAYMYYQFPFILSENNPEHGQYQLFKSLNVVTNVLRPMVKPSDVVVAGEKIAPMIPSLINAHVINGHDGNTENYPERVNQIRIFFYGAYTEEEVKKFLRTYQATHIIYGFDSLPFEQSPYKNFPFLEEVYKGDGWSIVKVVAYE